MKLKLTIAIFLVFLFSLSVNAFPKEELTKEDRAKFGIAQSFINLGKYKDAVDTLNALHKKYPDNKDITLILAQGLGYSLKLNEATILLKTLEEKFPEDKEIRFIHANILEANQHFTEARNIYFELLKKDLTSEEIQLRIADVSSWMGDYKTAISYYRRLDRLHKDDLEIKGKLADVLLWSKDYKAAIKAYQEIDVNPRDDIKRYKNLGNAYLGIGNYDEAIKIYRELLKFYPDNLEIKLDIANALYGAGKVEEAEKMFKSLVDENPGDIKLMIKIAEILALHQKYDEATGLCKDILSIDPHNNWAKLWLARILSWQKDYSESLSLYDEIIKENPDWIIARREKARVLGWTREYKESIREYKKIITQVRPDEATELEMNAKYNFYNFFDLGAIYRYKMWLEREPENLEALYDLGQVYGRDMQWQNAKDTYDHILKIVPSHFRALQALNKVKIYEKAPMAKTGFEWYEADSASRHINEKYYQIYLRAKKPLGEGIYLGAGEDTFIYLFSSPSLVTRQRFSVNLEYIKKPYLEVKAEYAYSLYSYSLRCTHDYKEEVNLKPLDATTFKFSHMHKEVLDNGEAFKKNIEKDEFKVRGELRPTRRILGGCDYTFSLYTDNNRKNEYGVDAGYILSYEPKFLKISYRFNEYTFKKPSGYYFSPSSFHTNTMELMWRHFLNKEELFWGTNNTYYTVKYTFNVDTGAQIGHKLYVDFHKDWNDKLSTHIEWSKKIYEHREIYSENMLMFYVKYYF